MHIPDVEKLFKYVDVGETVVFRSLSAGRQPPQVVEARQRLVGARHR